MTDVWFWVIALLWTGYFLLEGFDFGVGVLLPVLGRDELRRRVLINTIAPVWDGNEVWVITAGGATFAAFPEWYATMFSAFYLPLLLILVALIIRGVAFEYRGKRPDAAWKQRWDWCIVAGSAVPAFLWGVAFGNIVRGLKIAPVPRADGPLEYIGSFWDLLNPYALLTGVTTLLLFLTHGAVFLTLKTAGEIRDRARSVALSVGLAAAVAAVAFFAFTFSERSTGASITLGVLAAAAFVAGLFALRAPRTPARGRPGRPGRAGRPGSRREGWAFAGTAAAIALTVASL